MRSLKNVVKNNDLFNFLSKIFQVDPEKRATARDLLRDRFLVKYCEFVNLSVIKVD